MADISPKQEGSLERPAANAGAKAILLGAYITVANGHMKRIAKKMSLLAARLGLQPISSGNVNGINATVKCKNNIGNMAYETFEKTNEITYTITGLHDVLEKSQIDNSGVADISATLQEFAFTMKTECDKLRSLMEELQEIRRCSSKRSQKQ